MKNNIVNFNLDEDIIKLIDNKKFNIIPFNKKTDKKIDLILFDLDKKLNYRSIFKEFSGVSSIGLISPTRVRIATKLLKDGLTDYIVKSDNNGSLLLHIDSILNSKNKDSDISYMDMFNSSSKLKKTLSSLVKISNANIPILICGEQGCEHASYAKGIHNLSNRKNKAFLDVFCPTLTIDNVEDVIMSKIEKIDGGTIFFENVDLLDKKVQNLFSKFIDGIDKKDIRIISSTTKNLKEEVKNGNFKEDLYFLFSGSCLTIPALREIRSIIPILVKTLYKYYASEQNKKIKGITNKALKILENYNWPGNIKEIKTVIHKAVVLTNKDVLEEKDFFYLKNTKEGYNDDVEENFIVSLRDSLGNFKTMDVLEKEIIDKYLKLNNGNITEVAKLLNIGRTTLYRKLEDETK